MSEQVKKINPSNPFEPFFDEIRRIIREEIRDEIRDAGGANPDDHSTLLSAEKVAKLWNIPKTRIQEAARRGEIPSVKIGHYVRFRPEDLKAFVEQRVQQNSCKS